MPHGESLLYVARRNTFAQLRQKQRVVVGTEQAAQIQPVLNPCHRVATDRQTTLLLPLPITQTSPLSRSRCLISSLTSSDKRNPAPYITSSIARSRTASGSLRSISSSRLTSSTSIFLAGGGNFRRGNPFAGLALSSPRRPASRRNCAAPTGEAPACRANPARRLRTAKLRT